MNQEDEKQKKKKGKLFFLILIILSGAAVFSLLFLVFEGDKVTIYTIEKYVLNQEIIEKEFTEEVSPAERKEIISDLHQFFNSAKSGLESKERVALVGEKLRNIMEDQKITRDEVQELRQLLQTK